MKDCQRETCRRRFDPAAEGLGEPDYCSGTCKSLDSPAARASAEERRARLAEGAANRSRAARVNIQSAQAVRAARRQAAQAGAGG